MFAHMILIAGSFAGQSTDFFEARVRPVLVEHCFACHSAKKQSGGFRLDSRKALLEGGDNGPVVVPGHPEKSPLIAAIQHKGDVKMPPKGKLTPQAIDSLTAWVTMGLPWPEDAKDKITHQDPEAWKKHWAFQPIREPKVPTVGAWAATDVDRFILARLEKNKLTPSSEADRRTLIRRATFDLVGLPPTSAEVEAFERDEAPDAWARVIDRLLASPHYGERWGRYWLDIARFADTKGYVFFEEAAYPWAYTYRDYVIRAFNDDLPYDRFILEQLAADRLELGEDRRPLTGMGFLTAGGRFMNNVHDTIDDRIDVVTRGLMGLTVACARCHDHKYDPIPSKDYYSLYGVFASSTEPTVPPLFEPAPKTDEYRKFDAELRVREKKLTDFVQLKNRELREGARKRMAEYMLAAHALRDQPNTEDFMLLADTADLNPSMIQRWKVYFDRRAKRPDPVFRPWFTFTELPAQEFAARSTALAAKLEQDAALHPRVRDLCKTAPKSLQDLAGRYGKLFNELDASWQKDVRQAEDNDLWQVFYGDGAPPNFAMPTYGDLTLLPDRASQAKLQEHRKALEAWRSTGKGSPPRAMVLEDLPTPLEPHVFLRGNPGNIGEKVPRRGPMVLGAKETWQGSGRLELAKMIASRDNPLTARVLVNRVWLYHFGAGLVRTPGDFGIRSEEPSHPELLDFLASRFMTNGWSVKKLHRLIMLSSAYRQRSDDRPIAAATDPANRLLWKMNRRRLDFEATRDAVLAVSGRLDATIGGQSVKDNLAAGGRRRTLYSFLDRLNVPGLMRTFDFPSPDASSPERPQTTVAPQALYLMNHPFVQTCARELSLRKDIQGDTDRRVNGMFRIAYGRYPTAQEHALALEFVSDGTPANWERFAHALLMSNEFVVVD